MSSSEAACERSIPPDTSRNLAQSLFIPSGCPYHGVHCRSLSSRMSREVVLDALHMAMDRSRPGPGLIHHSDRGSQYACTDYREALQSHGMLCSMSRKGDCWDNAPMESWFHTLKTELINHRLYRTRQEAMSDIFWFIEVFYNRSRRHSALGYLTPTEYEIVRLAA